jgi:hypothetical protein
MGVWRLSGLDIRRLETIAAEELADADRAEGGCLVETQCQ